MKKLILFLTVCLVLTFNFELKAQSNVGNYTYLNAVGNYTPLVGDSIVVATNASNDDGITAAINIGFSFNFGNRTFTQVKLNTNGWLTFNTASVSTTQYAVLSSTETQVIGAFARDMNSSSSAMSVLIDSSGGAGNKIFKMQWKNQFSFTSTIVPAIANVQVWLYQATNIIEIRYGAYSAGARLSGSTVQVGLKSGSTAVDSVRSVSGTTWPAAAVSNSSASTVTISTAALPDSNRVFKFTPPPPPIANDVGVSAAQIGASAIQIISVGKGYNITATVKNFGTNTQTVIPVYYTDNGGAPVGPVNTVGPILQNGTENVTFSGGFAFSPLTAGLHNMRIYTALVGDAITSNDTLVVLVNVQQKISAYPYVQTFGNPVNWTVAIENAAGTAALWGLGLCTNPNGVASDTAAICDFYDGATLRKEVLRSPEMNISSLANPVLDFYVAYHTFTTEVDTLEVSLSTDGGVTWFSTVPVYKKNRTSVPSLSTLPAATPFYVPAASTNWRHETISLANVAGSGNLVIGFRGISSFGNNAWIDNVIVRGSTGYCSVRVPGVGLFSCNSLAAFNFTATPLPPGNSGSQNDNQSGIIDKSKSVANLVGIFPSQTGGGNMIANNQTDNPTGGDLSTTEYDLDPGVTGLGIAPNASATAPDGSVFTPNVVYQDYWFTATYTGNDLTGYATYDAKIDISSLVFNNPNRVYIVKRADQTGLWTAVNTTLAGNVLTAAGLTDFCDFGLSGDSLTNPLPVELASFVSTVNANNVTLNWTTTTETNNSGFDVERAPANGHWSKVGFVNGSGTSNSPKSYSYADRGLASGNYSYRLKQIDYNGHFTYYNLSNEVNVGIPVKFELSQNYPNPFNPSTKINYDLPFDSKVSIKLFDMSGKEITTIVNEVKSAGYYTASFNAANLSSGVYFYRISAEGNGQNFVATKKMMLVK